MNHALSVRPLGTLISIVVALLAFAGQSPAQQNSTPLYNAVWKSGTEGEQQMYGLKFQDFKATYDQVWPQGWRLYILQAYVLNDQVLYNAVWHQGTQGEKQAYGLNYQDFKATYDQLWNQGWRLYILQAYILNA